MANISHISTPGSRGRPHALPLWLVAAVLVLSGACNLLDVQDPDIVTPGNIADSTSLPTLRAAAIGDFTLAYSGSGASGSGGIEGQIMISGLLADEWINSETFPTRVEVDRRGPIAVDNATMQDVFRNLTRARRSAEFAVSKYREFVAQGVDTTRQPGLSEVLSLAGFTYVFFAENYCSGVPISNADPNTGALSFGPPLTTAQLLDSAVTRFTQALAAANALAAPPAVSAATKSARINLALVGLARAQVLQGNFAAAATTVGPVATSFAYAVQHTENTTRENNGVFVGNVINERYSVADREGNYAAGSCAGRGGGLGACVGGGPGLPFRSVADPRTPFTRATEAGVANGDIGFDNATPQFDMLRYFDRKNFVTLATGAEARLIEAEAFLRAGDPTNWLLTLNGLRTPSPPQYFAPTGSTLAAMAALADPGTATAREDQLFTERARWLWYTGHRLADLRRLVRQYGRAVSAVFPTGPYFKGGFTYGPDVNFPIPIDELNNPNFSQCIDRNP